MLKKVILISIVSVIFLSNIKCYAGIVHGENRIPCGPLHFAGITLGVTNDSEVKRLLGNGKLHNMGNMYKRYFVDSDRHATLHVTMHTNLIVNELTVMEGMDPILKKDEQEMPVSIYFDPTASFWRGLRLGSSKENVLEILGVPEKKNGDNEWVYSTSCCDSSDTITVFFRNGHIFKFMFTASPG